MRNHRANTTVTISEVSGLQKMAQRRK